MEKDDLGRLILRVTVGALMLLHGISKLGHGVGGIAADLRGRGLPGAVAYGVLVGEVVAPLLLVIGVWTRPAGLLLAVNMVVAVWMVHTHDLLHLGRGGGYALELQALYFGGGLAVA